MHLFSGRLEEIMAVKTITIDMEAYDLLAKARTGTESFSKVIKHVLGPAGRDARSLLDSLDAVKVPEQVLDALERVLTSRTDDLLAAESPEPYRSRSHGA
jgi:predicted CopG family antitoxin